MATIATLEPSTLAVDPGGQISTTIRVRNTGSTVDRFDLTIVGPMAAWASAQPASLSLFPGKEAEALIVFAPPRNSLPRAGTLPYGVRVAPAANPAGAVVEEGRITIGPYTDTSAGIVPATSRGSRTGRHDVTVENRGNTPVEVVVSASDPDRLVAFEVVPERLVVGAGERGGVTVRASAKDTFLLGSKQSHPFHVEVRPGKAPPVALRATLLQGPILPSWLPPIAGIALVAIIALIALPMLTGGGAPQSAAGESSAPAETAQPTSPPTPTPAPSEEASPSTEASPTPSPTPGPFKLALVDDQPEPFDGALRLRCPADDKSCRNNARDTLMLFINGLTVRYDGYGIANPRNTDVPNTLPVRLTRSTPFTWLADGGITGTSDIIVVDLAPLVADPPSYAYAVVDIGDGTSTRFVVPRATAQQLFDTLYEPAPQVVLPTVDLPERPEVGIDYVWNDADYSHLFLLFSPTP
jgi:hypothetical protein